ncbi:MAG: hypothetical protein ACI82F_003828 [Planctomycetota bacterium]|jgi:hypothetical protein
MKDHMKADATPDVPTQGASGGSKEGVEERIRALGYDLREAISAVLAAVPGSPHRPNQLASTLGCNRAVASRVLSATSKQDPMEVVHLIPGPEPLRRLVSSATACGVSRKLGEAAAKAIARFDMLIRNDAGTRPALDAIISSSLPGARGRFELSTKYSVYRGISQLKGAQAELWVGAAVIAPSKENPLKHDLTWLNGAAGMQRLRRGVTVRFSYRYRNTLKHEDHAPASKDDLLPALGVIPMDQFCVKPPAQLVARSVGQAIHYTLPDDLLGPKQAVDMFVVDHHPAAMNRYAKDAPRKRNSLFVEPAIPVASLLFDTILHEDAFPGSAPELYLYDTGYDGIANVNDPERDIDRVDLQESVEFLGHDLSRFHATELPNYGRMLMHLSERFGWDPSKFRAFRTRIQYPVYGWQVCMSFEPPAAPPD